MDFSSLSSLFMSVRTVETYDARLGKFVVTDGNGSLCFACGARESTFEAANLV